METSEMGILRKIVGKTGFRRTRSQDIGRQCDVQENVEWLTRRRDECTENVLRMASERTVRTLRDNSPRGGRSTGRPHRRLSDSHSGILNQREEDQSAENLKKYVTHLEYRLYCLYFMFK
jgi:hypothetical protein